MWTEHEIFLTAPMVPIATKPPRKIKYICSIDRRTYIVIRNKQAVKLGFLGFAIFRHLHEAKTRDKKLLSHELYDLLYSGTKDPAGLNTISSSIFYANRQLKHLGLKIKGTNRKQNSFYQIVLL